MLIAAWGLGVRVAKATIAAPHKGGQTQEVTPAEPSSPAATQLTVVSMSSPAESSLPISSMDSSMGQPVFGSLDGQSDMPDLCLEPESMLVSSEVCVSTASVAVRKRRARKLVAVAPA